MKKIFQLFLTVVATFSLISCTPVGDDTNMNTNTNESEDMEDEVDSAKDDSMKDDDSDEDTSMDKDETDETKDDSMTSEEATYVLYENKAIGYSLDRPDKFYWEHKIDSQISTEGLFDIFRTDRMALPSLETEYVGRIVFEVWDRPISDFEKGVSGFSSKSAMVGGISAKRYEGEKLVAQWIEYLFEKGGKTYRLYYNNTDMKSKDTEIFEHVVSSVKFQ